MSHVQVMVICYNYGRYLQQAVESVLTQSHRDLSVVILDDASTDETPAVSAALAAADTRVAVIRHPRNRGHIAAYNEGIDHARGDILLLLSADDFLLPGALERAVAAFEAFPEVGLVHGAWSAVPHDWKGQLEPLAGGPPKRLHAGRLLKQLAENNHVATATAFVRRREQQRLGHYRADLPHTGDLEMWVRFALHSQVAYIPQRQAAWRLHDRQMSKGYGPRADLAQCIAAFQPHAATIGSRPGGRLLLSQVQGRLALRARRAALRLLRQGELGAGLQVGLGALGQTVKTGARQVAARLGGT
jgi:glycosyltransferase involved in cell wall biosynthesis